MYLALLESSLAKRKRRVRGIATLRQVHMLHILSADGLDLPSKSRKHQDGTSCGDLLGPIRLNDWQFTATFAQKKEIYGRYRVAVGGRSTDAGDEEEEDVEDPADTKDGDPDLVPPTLGKDGSFMRVKQRDNDNVEPVFFLTYPPEYFDEITSIFNVTDIIHLTSGDGAGAISALRNRQGYFGMCFTDKHVEALKNYLVSWMLREFGRHSSPYFQPGYSLDPENDDEDKGKKRKKRDDEGTTDKKKKKKKKSKQQKSESDGGSGGSEVDLRSSDPEDEEKEEKKQKKGKRVKKEPPTRHVSLDERRSLTCWRLPLFSVSRGTRVFQHICGAPLEVCTILHTM